MTIMRVVDLSVVAASFIIAVRVRSGIEWSLLEPFRQSYLDYWGQLLIILILWWMLLYWNKMYDSQRGRSFWQVILIILKANLLGLLALGAILFFLQGYWINRALIMLFVVICTGLLILEKGVLFAILGRLRRQGRFVKYALIVGTGRDGLWLLNTLRSRSAAGIKVSGFVRNGSHEDSNEIDGVPVLGSIDDTIALLQSHVVDEVFVTTSLRDLSQIEPVLSACEEIGVNVRLLLRSLGPRKAKMFVDEFLDTPFVSFSTTPLSTLALHLKFGMDFVAATLLLMLLAPLGIVLATMIKLDSPGPVFFKQRRVGQNGRIFEIYKFRSMVADADQRRGEVEGLNIMTGPVFKALQDPRVTRMGRVLRRTSLDELPQLLNVVTGEMSLVGPRPMPVYESEQINGSARRRLSMKPGITGLWQVSGRSDIDFPERMRLDLEYIDQWSLWLDLRILVKTLGVLVSRKGAY